MTTYFVLHIKLHELFDLLRIACVDTSERDVTKRQHHQWYRKRAAGHAWRYDRCSLQNTCHTQTMKLARLHEKADEQR